MTLTRAKITAHLIKNNFPQFFAQSFVDDFFDIIAESLERGEEVKLSGFGSFEIKLKRQRVGRNPKTGEEVIIPSRKVVTFRAGTILQERLMSYNVLVESGTSVNLEDFTKVDNIKEQVEIIHEQAIKQDASGKQLEEADENSQTLEQDATLITSDEEDLLISSGEAVTVHPSQAVLQTTFSTPFMNAEVKSKPVLDEQTLEQELNQELDQALDQETAYAAYPATQGTPQSSHANKDFGTELMEQQSSSASTINRSTQLSHLSGIKQDMPNELMQTVEQPSNSAEPHTLFSQSANRDELYLDAQQRERNLKQEHKHSQEQQLKQAEEQSLRQEINREMSLKTKRKGQTLFLNNEKKH